MNLELRWKLAALFEKKPDLFEKIDLENYSSGPGLSGLDEELLTEDGKANWITIEDQTYWFRWSDVEEFGIKDSDEHGRSNQQSG